MADLKFARNTARILHALPHWFKMRKGNATSIGARFLNIAGLRLDELFDTIDYAYQQCYIDTADIDQVDYCYKAIIPMPHMAKNIKDIYAYGQGLKKAKDLKEFFGVMQHIGTSQLNGFNTFYVDEKRNIIYVRNKFNIDATYENGYIEYEYEGKKYKQELIPHKVWNFFDEFGLLLCTPRIEHETNQEYKERIKDVFRNPANASRDGLINGIGRELALRRTITWTDTDYPLELEDAMVVLNSIKVNGEYIDLNKVFISESGSVCLMPIYANQVEVTYIYGLEMHKLWNKDNDIKLQNEIFTIDGIAKTHLKEYIEILDSECPIFWDKFHWNEHYWDSGNFDATGYGTIPILSDGSIRGFRNYNRPEAVE